MAKSFTPGESSGSTAGATPVTVIPAPTAGARMIRSITIYNEDTANVKATIQQDDGGGKTKMATRELAPDQTLLYEVVQNLTGVQLMEVVLAGAVSATEPTWKASWADLEDVV